MDDRGLRRLEVALRDFDEDTDPSARPLGKYAVYDATGTLLAGPPGSPANIRPNDPDIRFYVVEPFDAEASLDDDTDHTSRR